LRSRFFSWNQIRELYSLIPSEEQAYNKLVSSTPSEWIFLFTNNRYVTWDQEYLGVFNNANYPSPKIVFATAKRFCPRLGPGHQTIKLSSSHPSFIVGVNTSMLRTRSHLNSKIEQIITGWLRRVQRIQVQKKPPLYVGIVSELEFDPERWA